MSKKTFGIRFLLGGIAMFLGAAAPSMADTWWNQAYSKRLPITITNPGGGALPTPNMSAELKLDPVPVEARADGQDLRVLYTPDSGTTWTELDRKVYRDGLRYATEDLNAGKTDFASLPAGSLISFAGNGASLDDNWTILTLPFAFPYRNGKTNSLYVAIDGFIAPNMTSDPGRPDKVADAQKSYAIMPWQSDLAITDTATMGVWADLTNPNQVTIRWIVQESASGPIIAKFAVILKPDGSIRFVYGDTVKSPSAGIADPANGGYSPIKYGIGAGSAATSIVTAPTFPADFSNHTDILYQQTGAIQDVDRVVFRLMSPLADGANSTGQYFLYYGDPSPLPPPSDPKNVYDYTVDASAGTVGQPAADWTALRTGTATIDNAYGVKSIVLRNTTGGVSHPEYIVNQGSMPKFKDVEMLARFVAPGGENEIAPLMRVIQDPNDANYGGAVGYVTDGFGSSQGFVSYVNPVVSQGPAIIGALVDGANPTGIAENVLARYQGQILNGKKWMDSETQPTWLVANVDRTASTPAHGTTNDPIYDQAGGTGIGSYSTQGIAVQYISMRELRTTSAAGAAATLTPTAIFVQGKVSSSVSAFNPLATASVHIVGGATDVTIPVGANGDYRIVLPAGTYSVTASERFHTAATTTGVTPSATAQTDFTLVYVGSTVTGVVRYGLTNQKLSGAKVTLIDSAGMYVDSTTTDANGVYTIKAPTGGSYSVGVEATNGTGDRKTLTLVSAATVTANFSTKLVSNGDAEIPNTANTAPDEWSQAFDTPGAYLYTQDQNHTPGGKWSIAIKDPSTPAGQGNNLSCWNPPPSGFYDLPARPDLFGVRVSVWVYFSKTGQKARLRLRNNWPVASVDIVAGQAPPASNDNQGGLVNGLVPAGQWYEIASKVPAGTALANNALQVNLYAVNAAGGGSDGTVYFDDLSITQTPVAQVYGQVKDETGAPVANAVVGTMSNAGGLADNILVDSPALATDENGNYVLYQPAVGSALLGAWAFPAPSSTGAIANYGYTVDSKTVNVVANPTSPTNFTIHRATNVAKGTTFTAKETDTGTDLGKDTNLPPANAVDDNLNSRWASSPP
ncbi:MAG TPA: carboxypeptidase regulatory-like domain-containing protein, partial [Armatimonadota bacterium]